jgi:hypothetical protein
MSDESKKLASGPGGTVVKSQTDEGAPEKDAVPEDIVTPVDGEIDLARLAPQLRGLYRELLNEPIPDRFTKLLEELASKETDGQ